MNMDVDKLQDFVKNTNAYLNSLCEEQEKINKRYVDIKEEWSDNVLVLVGLDIMEAQNIIINVYKNLYDQIRETNRHGEYIAEKYLEEKWDGIKMSFDEEISRINVEEIMNKRVIRGTTAEGIKSFETALENYIEETYKLKGLIKKEHEEIGCSWKDKQYKKVSEIMDEFQYNMESNLKKLNDTLELVKEKRKIFEEIE